MHNNPSLLQTPSLNSSHKNVSKNENQRDLGTHLVLHLQLH